MSIIVGVVKST